ncbi:hypothetical protein [Lacinutrix sp. Hel_I_90]|uniref:hypothetical protein n=1 Tax=Lacinutrix sp. Hel_I_90 TaxID=1249999 RepID=UPI0005C85BA0|nr:hypothetical protein [Lacinutrix sp. Hel_I_90]
MNKIKNVSLLVVSLLLITFFSCENEPLEGFDLDANTTVPNNSNVTPVVGENVAVETSTGDYWPAQVGYVWNYNTVSFGNTESEIMGTTTFGNQNYFEYNNFMGQSGFFVRKEGSNYYVAQDITGTNINGYTLSAPVIVILLLKDNLDVGETFTQDVNYTVSYTPDSGVPAFPDQNVTATYITEMIERDFTYTVGGVDYEDVLHINVQSLYLGNIVATSDYYFAKDIGPIHIDQSAGQGGFLTSYQF